MQFRNLIPNIEKMGWRKGWQICLSNWIVGLGYKLKNLQEHAFGKHCL